MEDDDTLLYTVLLVLLSETCLADQMRSFLLCSLHSLSPSFAFVFALVIPLPPVYLFF